MADDEQSEPRWVLLMPFIVVASEGGPYEDAAYSAGWEAGQVDHQAATLAVGGSIEATVHVENLPQIDLVAMRRGCTVGQQPVDGYPGWAWVRLTKNVEISGA